MPRFAPALVGSCIVLVLVALPLPTSAEPIPVTITGQSLDFTMISVVGTLSLAGDHGFTFMGEVDALAGIFGPWRSCPCSPGAPVALDSLWVDSDLRGVTTFEGVTYPTFGSSGNSPFGFVMFTGGSIIAPLDGLTGTATAPFLFQGQFTFPPMTISSPPSPPIVASLFGKGTATLDFQRPSPESPWFYRAALYQFEPVPEPPHSCSSARRWPAWRSVGGATVTGFVVEELDRVLRGLQV